MPAYWSTSSSSFDSSSGHPRCSTSIPSIQFSFFEYLRHFKTDDSFTNLMTTIFGRQDLITKTNEIKHLAKLVQWLQDEANEQQDYMIGIFDAMKAAGLDQILGRKYVWDDGIIRKRQGIHPQMIKGQFLSIDRWPLILEVKHPFHESKNLSTISVILQLHPNIHLLHHLMVNYFHTWDQNCQHPDYHQLSCQKTTFQI